MAGRMRRGDFRAKRRLRSEARPAGRVGPGRSENRGDIAFDRVAIARRDANAAVDLPGRHTLLRNRDVDAGAVCGLLERVGLAAGAFLALGRAYDEHGNARGVDEMAGRGILPEFEVAAEG